MVFTFAPPVTLGAAGERLLSRVAEIREPWRNMNAADDLDALLHASEFRETTF